MLQTKVTGLDTQTDVLKFTIKFGLKKKSQHFPVQSKKTKTNKKEGKKASQTQSLDSF